VLDLDRDMFGI
ncbi:hypothetical protein A2U01_0110034, partial [Trifolium medium]|nr:hypothetical protein [Trifolium medium]